MIRKLTYNPLLAASAVVVGLNGVRAYLAQGDVLSEEQRAVLRASAEIHKRRAGKAGVLSRDVLRRLPV
jgi:phosphoenolpyruvate-protein kinase (PTS system EI component)